MSHDEVPADARERQSPPSDRSLSLTLLSRATAIAHEAETTDRAWAGILKLLCRHAGWPAGAVLVPASHDPPCLVSSGVIHLEDPERWRGFPEFWQTLTWESPEQLVVRVMRTKQPEWSEAGALARPGFVVGLRLLDLGVRSAIAFPVLLGDEVTAVAVFARCEGDPPDPVLVEAVADIGVQLGRVVERTRSAQALRESEARYRSLFERSADAMLLIDGAEFIDCNQAAVELFGLADRRAIRSLAPWDLSPPRQANGEISIDAGHRRILEALDRGSVLFEWTHRRTDGHCFPAEIALTSVSVGASQYLHAVVRDVSDRKRAEGVMRALVTGDSALVGGEFFRTMAGQLAATLEARAVLIAECAGEENLRTLALHADGAAVAIEDLPLAGTAAAQVLTGQSCAIAAGARGRFPSDALLGRLEAEGYVGVPLFDSDARPIGIVAAVTLHALRDARLTELTLTTFSGRIAAEIERMRAEAERERLEAMVARTQRLESLGVLAGGIAHDFNNILSVIGGFTELAAKLLRAGSPEREYLGHVETATARARDLVGQILTFSRQGESAMQPTDLCELLEEVLGFARSTLPTTIEIRREIETERATVLADGSQIHQVLMNLCTNAHHAMRESGGVLSVGLRLLEIDADEGAQLGGLAPGRYARIAVADTGCGMSPETRDRIFDPFFTTKAPGEGTGLGLAVAHGIIAHHGGSIGVHSEPGRGTVFHVNLPLVPDSGSARSESQDEPPTGAERILVVDDEHSVAALAEQMLASLGYRVTARTRSLDALALLREDPTAFDLLLTDETMPELRGAELAARARALNPRLPVVLSTGFWRGEGEGDPCEAVHAILTKPYSLRRLAEAVRRALDGG